jgi:RNA polymerase sigma-70 factor (ECF subfamily)
VTSAVPPPPSGPQDGPPRRLGELLYRDRAQPPISEKEWVELIDGIAARDVRALHGLYERTHRLVFTLALRTTSRREVAEEITLDVFNDVWRHAATYDPATGSVLGWIMTRVRSRALGRLQLDDPTPGGSGPDEGTLSTSPMDVDEGASLRVQGRLLREALMALNPAEREAVETFLAESRTPEAIAARLNQPVDMVTVRIRSGLDKLRHALARTMGPR